MKKQLDLEAIFKYQRKFASDREWEQFHTPKNLAMALSVEASELLEIFQWLTPEQSKNIEKNTEKANSPCNYAMHHPGESPLNKPP